MSQKFTFYNGLEHKIVADRLIEFDSMQVERYFSDPSTMEVSEMFEDLGSFAFDYTNLQPWGNEIPDIHEHSARIFSLWAEETETKYANYDIVVEKSNTYIAYFICTNSVNAVRVILRGVLEEIESMALDPSKMHDSEIQKMHSLVIKELEFAI